MAAPPPASQTVKSMLAGQLGAKLLDDPLDRPPQPSPPPSQASNRPTVRRPQARAIAPEWNQARQ